MTKDIGEPPPTATDTRRPRDARPPPHPYEGTGNKFDRRLAVLILGYGVESPVAHTALTTTHGRHT